MNNHESDTRLTAGRMNEITGAAIHISGIVQGVGFRPFVYNLAASLHLLGWVRNTSAGVDIRLDGSASALQEFVLRLRTETPPLAHIEQIDVKPCQPDGFTSFDIIQSETVPGAFQPISPDICICKDCLKELFDPTDRRYRYPFTNCTNCGPRFTIIQDIPYDRPQTTMAGFPLCPDCQAEYEDPTNRRFHAQPVACPVCGPQVWLEFPDGTVGSRGDQAILSAQEYLSQGKILAVKGLGGFHLACDATNSDAVSELRRRKLRAEKPFAVMVADISEAAAQCSLNQTERELLVSRERPIVILDRLLEATISSQVSPGQNTIGLLLPYTPLHCLLFSSDGSIRSPARAGGRRALVMTSGNLSEEPIASDNQEARERLHSLADAYLMHDRPIYIRCDDSVVRSFQQNKEPHQAQSQPHISSVYPIRRSRGYAPFPVHLPFVTRPVLATGAELKNTFCIARAEYAFLSQHIGDMENYETYQSFETGVAHFEKLYRLLPEAIAHDIHPDYLATRYALERSASQQLPTVAVQHHHAHVAACMVENGLDPDAPVIGIAFDGTGYGLDGAIWGGEFLIATLAGFQRAAHLAYYPLPGGDRAIRKPARAALAYLWKSGQEWFPESAPAKALCAEERTALSAQLTHAINTPLTSSMGRLFDVVASIAGIRQQVSYEAQAAIELESVIDLSETGSYEFIYFEDVENESICIDPGLVLQSVTQDALNGLSPSRTSARFHNGTTNMVLHTCRLLREKFQIDQVVLSGGVWQNMSLLRACVTELEKNGFSVHIHHQVPTNDGGISLGQAAIAAALFRNN
jgi:hydrogenase maturation protein HypF